jgi:hypothetical protein
VCTFWHKELVGSWTSRKYPWDGNAGRLLQHAFILLDAAAQVVNCATIGSPTLPRLVHDPVFTLPFWFFFCVMGLVLLSHRPARRAMDQKKRMATSHVRLDGFHPQRTLLASRTPYWTRLRSKGRTFGLLRGWKTNLTVSAMSVSQCYFTAESVLACFVVSPRYCWLPSVSPTRESRGHKSLHVAGCRATFAAQRPGGSRQRLSLCNDE